VNYWLVKTEPEEYSWDDFTRDGSTFWDGVRNYQARNNLQAMQNGDVVLFYHSGDERAVVGTATVSKTAYQDPTTDETAWVCVDLKKGKRFKNPIALTAIKATPALANMALLKQARLSVVPVLQTEFDVIDAMGRV
jgi:predicted RNA-binding protein with PUA-like domain